MEEYRLFSKGFYIRIKAVLIDKSILMIREYVDDKERNYSYHWIQSEEYFIRWDSAPYHKNIATFPHHYHINKEVFPSYQIAIKDILKYIEKEIKR